MRLPAMETRWPVAYEPVLLVWKYASISSIDEQYQPRFQHSLCEQCHVAVSALHGVCAAAYGRYQFICLVKPSERGPACWSTPPSFLLLLGSSSLGSAEVN